MQNLVKQETYPALEKLHEADIETVMVTGDNILTGISVGRDCKLIRPGTTIIKVEADVMQEFDSTQLNVSYYLTESDKPGANAEVRFEQLKSLFFYIFQVLHFFKGFAFECGTELCICL